YMRYALMAGHAIEDIYRRTRIDRWFLYHLQDLVAMEDRLRACASVDAADAELLWDAKQHGFSDRQLATIWNSNDPDVRRARQAHGVVPVFKLVDTCAAEFEAYTPYYYSTYVRPSVSIKSEVRNPKSETNPNEQNPYEQNPSATVSDIGDSDLGFVSDFGFRISDFSGAEDE